MNILVTGATGNFGGYALKVLQDLVPEDNLYGLARTEEKGAKLKEAGIKVRIGDYTDSASLQKAFEGIDRLLFVSSTTDGDRQAQHRDVVEAAKAAGVSYIAYTSFGKATESTSPLAADHRFTEQLIEESGIAHTFLRNNWYLENEAAFLAAGAKGGKFIYAGGNGQAGWALRREYAEVAARAVSGKFDFPKILELGGSLRTYEDLGAALRGATGKDLEVISADEATAAKNLVENAGVPQNVAELLVSFQQIVKSGALAVQPDDFEKYLGKPLTPMVDAIKEVLG
ncbi:SDR family oxidoreductase [Pediococcus acidilactici]|uniref:SDR family oxidoreductase n=1 Tax=Pediococcus acidilactici TaxID=1254 RepID=A0AAW8YH17_PEDAC|nr:SDR family oxidoreductase [Pediococcus acidilactici]GAC45610.1 nucleoside-diphosphate-sugar epimerase [Pediococcus acidilactici NGRI 0510Q]AOW74579.1 NAD(P)-dependent oxidoreductase [Pediococcus acidilactici]KRN90829.1 nucleoside-diphosphate-sugar epimerase [Pediococcus acidilactici]MDD9323331.1 SDR family oxidoreductase [Pediococcus acidilactici]MDV2620819.1 SDR family oxidoreductase [Pediococcus acidilactici]